MANLVDKTLGAAGIDGVQVDAKLDDKEGEVEATRRGPIQELESSRA